MINNIIILTKLFLRFISSFLNQPIEQLLKELNASEESWVQTKVQPFVAPTSINMLRITLVSVIQLTEYLLNNGFDSVMTGKYNQDCLEVYIGFFQKNKIWLTVFTNFNKFFFFEKRFFGLIRTAGGSDDKPSCSSFLQLYRMLSLYYPTKRILGSNVDDAERLRLLTSYKDGLMKAYNENKKDALLLKQKVKDRLLRSIMFEAQHDTSINIFTNYC